VHCQHGKSTRLDQQDMYLRVVLGVTSMQSNRLEVQAAIEIDGGNDVSLRHTLSLNVNREAVEGYTHCKVGTMPLTPGPAPGVAAGVAGVTSPGAF
jgi:hypothetical protein